MEGRVLLVCFYPERNSRITKQDLYKIFESWGEVTSIEISKSNPAKFQAFICFADAADAKNVLLNEKSIYTELGRLKVYPSNKKFLYHTTTKPSLQPRSEPYIKPPHEVNGFSPRCASYPGGEDDSVHARSTWNPLFSQNHRRPHDSPFFHHDKHAEYEIPKTVYPSFNVQKNFLCITGFRGYFVEGIYFYRLLSCFGRISQLLVDFRLGYLLVKFADPNNNLGVQRILNQFCLFGVQLMTFFTNYEKIDKSSLSCYSQVEFYDENFDWPSQVINQEIPFLSKFLLIQNINPNIQPEHFFKILSQIHEPGRFILLKRVDEDEGNKIVVECLSITGALEIIARFNGEVLYSSRLQISFVDPSNDIVK